MKSKLMTRILLLAIALLMVLSMAACNKDDGQGGDEGTTAETTGSTNSGNGSGNGGDKTETTTGKEEGPNIPAGLNFNNAEFKAYIRGMGGDGVDYGSDLYVGRELSTDATAVERAVYTRMSSIEDTYGVIFDVQIEDGGLNKTIVDNSSKTGVDVYDLVVDHGRFMMGYAEKNSLLDFAKLPYVDVDQPWWSQEVNETFRTPGGKLFVMTGDISYLSVGTTFSMFFNKDIIADVQGLESPYQKVDDKEWTFEEFEGYVLATDSNLNGDGSGIVGQDKFGYATGWWRGPVQMFYTTGGRVLVREDDAWKFTLNSNKANKALVDFRELMFTSGSAHLEKADNYQNLQLSFVANQIAFFDDQLHAASVFKGSDLNFGLLPWPMYDDEVEEYYSAVDAGTNLYGVLRNTSEANAQKISVVLECLAYQGSKDVIPFYFDTILSYQYLKDDDSINMLHIIHDSMVIDFGYFYSGLSSTFRNVAIEANGDSLNKVVSATKDVALQNLEKWDALDNED